MTEPLSDRLLDALGDPVARRVVRRLLEGARGQSDLIAELGVGQATVSRAVKLLRAVGLVAPTGGGRSPRLRITGHRRAVAVLLAVDRLADELLEEEGRAQGERSDATRRAAVHPTNRPRRGDAADGT